MKTKAVVKIEDIDAFRAGRSVKVTVNDGGALVSSGTFRIARSAFANSELKVLLAAGISTPVEYRRRGYVRAMFEHMHKLAADEGCAAAILHTFSFAFYRKFGYEKVSNHLSASFPLSKLDFVPACADFVPCGEEKTGDLIKIYDRFSAGRNLLLKRSAYSDFSGGRKYICYIDGEPAAYVCLDSSVRFDVNRLTDTRLFVREYAFVSPETMRKLFSFLRMFEGEYEIVEFCDCAMAPEIELMLRHYNHTEYAMRSDLEARVIDTRKILEANTYPKEAGSFTLKIIDDLPTAAGCFRVDFGGGDVRVTEEVNERADLELTAGAFIRLAYGLDGVNASQAAYMDGVKFVSSEVNGCSGICDFFRAFPKRSGGIFEHF